MRRHMNDALTAMMIDVLTIRCCRARHTPSMGPLTMTLLLRCAGGGADDVCSALLTRPPLGSGKWMAAPVCCMICLTLAPARPMMKR